VLQAWLGGASGLPAWSRGACSAALLAELGDAFRSDTSRLSTAVSVCEAHGKDESYHAAIGPDAVVFPTSTAEVSQASDIHWRPQATRAATTPLVNFTKYSICTCSKHPAASEACRRSETSRR